MKGYDVSSEEGKLKIDNYGKEGDNRYIFYFNFPSAEE